MSATPEQKMKIKQMLVERLRLKIEPASIVDGAPLFREGLGLDSIDALELVSGIEQSFGVVIESEAKARTILKSVDTIADFLIEQGALA